MYLIQVWFNGTISLGDVLPAKPFKTADVEASALDHLSIALAWSD